jgi:hypothetical protein
MSFRADYEWQLQFLPAIKNIVGPLLVEPAPLDLDTKEATDMLILMARDMRVACRIRRSGYAERYPWEFTIRSKRDSGARTELEKVIGGWGDWMFYAHAQHDQLPMLSRWFVIDLSAWRAQAINTRNKAGRPTKKSNGDGTHFVAFDLRYFRARPPILIASSHELPDVFADNGGADREPTLPRDSATA